MQNVIYIYVTPRPPIQKQNLQCITDQNDIILRSYMFCWCFRRECERICNVTLRCNVRACVAGEERGNKMAATQNQPVPSNMCILCTLLLSLPQYKDRSARYSLICPDTRTVQLQYKCYTTLLNTVRFLPGVIDRTNNSHKAAATT